MRSSTALWPDSWYSITNMMIGKTNMNTFIILFCCWITCWMGLFHSVRFLECIWITNIGASMKRISWKKKVLDKRNVKLEASNISRIPIEKFQKPRYWFRVLHTLFIYGNDLYSDIKVIRFLKRFKLFFIFQVMLNYLSNI